MIPPKEYYSIPGIVGMYIEAKGKVDREVQSAENWLKENDIQELSNMWSPMGLIGVELKNSEGKTCILKGTSALELLSNRSKPEIKFN